jgi:hypothetical protein
VLPALSLPVPSVQDQNAEPVNKRLGLAGIVDRRKGLRHSILIVMISSVVVVKLDLKACGMDVIVVGCSLGPSYQGDTYSLRMLRSTS